MSYQTSLLRELFGRGYDQFVKSLRLEKMPVEMRDDMIELLGENVFHRVLTEVLMRLSPDHREAVVQCIEKGELHGAITLVRTHVPDVESVVHLTALKELNETVTQALG